VKIDVAKEDLFSLRYALKLSVERMEGCPNPSAWGEMPKIARKAIRKLNAALKKVHGHDCHGDMYL
jgi:hypothetical protein